MANSYLIEINFYHKQMAAGPVYDMDLHILVARDLFVCKDVSVFKQFDCEFNKVGGIV